MASIIKRKSKYSVVYRYVDENGNDRQKWETFSTKTEAKKRKSEIEHQQNIGDFTVPTSKTVSDLLDDYVSIYGLNVWALSTYDAKCALIHNYIKPMIGEWNLSSITTHMVDQYYKQLSHTKSVPKPYLTERSDYISARLIKEIHKLLRSAFNQAVRWEIMAKNPTANATLPKYEAEKRDIWTADTLFKAIKLCDDEMLALALNLAFSCSLRKGEMLGLTWDSVDITDPSIDRGTASIFVDKELQRVSKESLQQLDSKGVKFVFPPLYANNSTSLILKEPKTKTSTRRIYLPQTVARMLIQHRAEQQELKELLGEEYVDFNLVFASPNGRPVEGALINRALNKLIAENDLPKVCFHSLRHSSITYKLKLNGGDMKSVQGDSGHAQLKMVSDVYSHILDEDRCKNAQNFEAAFYSQPAAQNASSKKSKKKTSSEKLLELLADSPELADKLLASLAALG